MAEKEQLIIESGEAALISCGFLINAKGFPVPV